MGGSERRKRVLIYMHYMEIGGAERALLGMLDSIDPQRIDVDLFLNQHTGELYHQIPEYVRILPQLPEYSAIERPIKTILKEGHINIAFRRIMAKMSYRRYIKGLSPEEACIDESIYQYVFRSVIHSLPSLEYLGEYDLAISYLHPHNIVAEKVKARKKVCWIHTDYSTIHINRALEADVWGAYDAIASISDAAGKAFGKLFPELRDKLFTFENLLPVRLILREAEAFDAKSEMVVGEDEMRILSIGRYSVPKRFDDVPRMSRIMLDMGLKFKWFIIGFGPEENIRENISRYQVTDTVVLLGKKANPYPYIKACDIYAQPSLYEGKSVTVSEAQLLCRPTVISNYPTACDQLTDGEDGVIVPLEVEACARGIYEFAKDKELQQRIIRRLRERGYNGVERMSQLYSLLQ